jgi:hypothetical protein
VERKTNLIPWIVGGLIVLVLIYFAVQGGIGAATDESSKAADQNNSYSTAAPASEAAAR